MPLDLQLLKIIVFIDTSFANNINNTSQIGFIIIIANNSSSANIVY